MWGITAGRFDYAEAVPDNTPWTDTAAQERQAFESAIDANPLEATNHLTYADWLDEHGEADEAAFRRKLGGWFGEHEFRDLPSAGSTIGSHPNRDGLSLQVNSTLRTPWIIHGHFSGASRGTTTLPTVFWTPPHVFDAPADPDYHGRVYGHPNHTAGEVINPDEAHESVARWHPSHRAGWMSWPSYRGMEQGLRLAFMRTLAVRRQQDQTNASRYASTLTMWPVPYVDDDAAQDEPEEWDGTIDDEDVNGDEYFHTEDYRQWDNWDSNGERYPQTAHIESGTYPVMGVGHVPVFRWVHHDHDGDEVNTGDWTTELDEARHGADQYADSSHEDPPDPDDSHIDDVNGQSWRRREHIADFDSGGDTHSVRLDTGTFQFAGQEHEVYRWTTYDNQFEDGDWTLDRDSAVEGGRRYAEDNHDPDDDDLIHGYDYKPDWEQHGDKPPFMGAELETQLRDTSPLSLDEAAQHTLDVLNNGYGEEGFAFLKNDSSIETGSPHSGKGTFEIVTHPATLDVHRQQWAPFFANLPQGLISHDANAGLHVHVGRNDLTDLAIGKMVYFVNHPDNKNFLTKLARRESQRWAGFDPTKRPWDVDRSGPRYVALNLKNRHTIEFRLFRGSLKPDSFFAALEFVDALVNLSRPANVSTPAMANTNALFNYVVTYHKDYPHLLNFIEKFVGRPLVKRGPKKFGRDDAPLFYAYGQTGRVPVPMSVSLRFGGSGQGSAHYAAYPRQGPQPEPEEPELITRLEDTGIDSGLLGSLPLDSQGYLSRLYDGHALGEYELDQAINEASGHAAEALQRIQRADRFDLTDEEAGDYYNEAEDRYQAANHVHDLLHQHRESHYAADFAPTEYDDDESDWPYDLHEMFKLGWGANHPDYEVVAHEFPPGQRPSPDEWQQMRGGGGLGYSAEPVLYMTTEDDFQRQLDAQPDDHQTRLVFADWLQDQNDPRAAGYRALGALGRIPMGNQGYWLTEVPGDEEWDRAANPASLPRAWGYHDDMNQSLHHRAHGSRREAEDAAALFFAGLDPETQQSILNPERTDLARYAATLYMTTEDDFHRQLDANPNDHHTRLVFADYLDEQGDPRAAGYRALGVLGVMPHRFHNDSGYSSQREYAYHSGHGTTRHPNGFGQEPAYGVAPAHSALPQDWLSAITGHPTSHWGMEEASINYPQSRKEAEDVAARAFSKLPPERQHQILNSQAPAEPEQDPNEYQGVHYGPSNVIVDDSDLSGGQSFFHQHPGTGHVVSMGTVDGPWGAAVYPNADAYHNGDPPEPFPGDFATFEELLQALRTAGLVHPRARMQQPANDDPNEYQGVHYARKPPSADLPDSQKVALILKRRRLGAANQQRFVNVRRAMDPAELFRHVHRHLTERGTLNRGTLQRLVGLDAPSLDAALAHGVETGQIQSEERSGRADGSGRRGQFWSLTAQPSATDEPAEYADYPPHPPEPEPLPMTWEQWAHVYDLDPEHITLLQQLGWTPDFPQMDGVIEAVLDGGYPQPGTYVDPDDEPEIDDDELTELGWYHYDPRIPHVTSMYPPGQYPTPDEFDELHPPGSYARYDDNEAFGQAAARDPLDWQNQMVWADFLQDRDHPDASFRRAVGGSIQRRLGQPWQPPHTTPSVPSGAPFLSAVQPPSGPSHPFATGLNATAGGAWNFMSIPGLSTTDNRPDPHWIWMVPHPQPGLPHAGRGDFRDPRFQNVADWYAERRGRLSDEGMSAQWEDADELTPEERIYAGIDDLRNMDPVLWPHLERLMRRQFGMGQSHEQLSRYSQSLTYASPDPHGPENGALTPEQHQIAAVAHQSGDPIDWGALGDHLAENGYPNSGAVLSSVAAGAPGTSHDHYPALPGAWASYGHGDFHSSIGVGAGAAIHHVTLRLGDGVHVFRVRVPWSQRNDNYAAYDDDHDSDAPTVPNNLLRQRQPGQRLPFPRAYPPTGPRRPLAPRANDALVQAMGILTAPRPQPPAQSARYSATFYMTTEDDFHAALDANPDDHHARLVFADYLDEQGDPRAAGYRALGVLQKRPHGDAGNGWAHPDNGWVTGAYGQPVYVASSLPLDWHSLIQAPPDGRDDMWKEGWDSRKDSENSAAHAFSQLPPERQQQILNPERTDSARYALNYDYGDTDVTESYAEHRGWDEPTAYGLEDNDSFLARLATDPTDATVHGVYADWLDEQGDAHNAGFHRAMADHLRMNHPDPEFAHDMLDLRMDNHARPIEDEQGGSSLVGVRVQNLPDAARRFFHTHSNFNPPYAAGHMNAVWQRLSDGYPYLLWDDHAQMLESLRRAHDWHIENPPEDDDDAPQGYQAVHYAEGDEADVLPLMRSISPAAWRGDHEQGDMTPRLALADLMDERGRAREAAMLRDTHRHLYVDFGHVIEDAHELARQANDTGYLPDNFTNNYIREAIEQGIYQQPFNWVGQDLTNHIHPNTLAAMVADSHHVRALWGGDGYHRSDGHNFYHSRNTTGHEFSGWHHYPNAGMHEPAQNFGPYELHTDGGNTLDDPPSLRGSYEVDPTVPPIEQGTATAHRQQQQGIDQYALATAPTMYNEANQSDLPAMLHSISPQAWRGWTNQQYSAPFDMTPRVVAADFFDELGRSDEAALLRDTTKHVYMHNGRVNDATDLSRDFHQNGLRSLMHVDQNDHHVAGYLRAALWASVDHETGEPLDGNYDLNDIHPATMAAMVADARHFADMHYAPSGMPNVSLRMGEREGRNFWLSRNGHGSGFFDDTDHYGDEVADYLQDAAERHHEYDLDVGDDGMLHGSYEVPWTEPQTPEPPEPDADPNAQGPYRPTQSARYALNYGADQSTVDAMLHELSQPHHGHTRWATPGHPENQHHLRAVAADALQDNGRDQEAGWLRDPNRHVLIQNGQVQPGRFTPEPVEQALAHYGEIVHQMTGGLFNPDHEVGFEEDRLGRHYTDDQFDEPRESTGHGEVRVVHIDPNGYEPHGHANVHRSELGNYLADHFADQIDPWFDWENMDTTMLDHADQQLRNAPYEELDSSAYAWTPRGLEPRTDSARYAAIHYMTTEDDFHRQLDANPDDHQTRMVFADWLDEQGDPRGPGYRALGMLGVKPRPYYNGQDRPPMFSPDDPPTEFTVWRHRNTGANDGDDRIFNDWHALIPSGHNHDDHGQNYRSRPSRRELEDAAALAFSQLPPARQHQILNPERTDSARYAGTMYMTTEDDFHAALDAQPDDHQTRMVFADWLDEQGDPRGPGYRALGTLGRIPHRSHPEAPGHQFTHGDAGGWAHEYKEESHLPVDWFNLVPGGNLNFKWFGSRKEMEDATAHAFSQLPPERQHQLLNPERTDSARYAVGV